jgi:hypothetical protein
LSNIIYFEETQRFRQWWLWVLLVIAVAGVWVTFIAKFLVGRLNGDKPDFDGGMFAIWLLVGVGLPLLFWFCRLQTRVTEHVIWLRFTPFHLKPVQIPIRGIISAEAVTYSPLMDFGGWGIRWGLKGKAYNVSGNHGVQLEYGADGKRLLIGSQNSPALAEAIRKAQQAVVVT